MSAAASASDGRCDQALNLSLPTGPLPAADPNDPNRKTWTLPEIFSQADDALYFSNQFVMRSRDRGKTWEKISPDLSRVNPEVPRTLEDVYKRQAENMSLKSE